MTWTFLIECRCWQKKNYRRTKIATYKLHQQRGCVSENIFPYSLITALFFQIESKFTYIYHIFKPKVFHRFGPLGRVGLAVVMSVRTS